MTGKNKRTLKFIKSYPTPKELYEQIVNSEGWDYKRNREKFLIRDRALVAILYLLALRISEALRLQKEQFIFPEDSGREDAIIVREIKLSKSRWKDKPRKEQYRQEAFLPLKGPRAELTKLVLHYLAVLEPQDKLFKFGTSRAWQIVIAMLDVPCHWLRAYGENFLYDMWKHDLLAVSDYIKVNVRTLSLYIKKGYEKYEPV